MALRGLIKKMLPARIKPAIGRIVMRRRERMLGRLPLSQAFDEVYKQRMWKQGDALSGEGSEGLMADRYVAFVQDYAIGNGLKTVFDGGCGDFAIGSRLATGFERYEAADVSPHIIDVNRLRYTGSRWKNVSFSVVDLSESRFPDVDLVLIRQVLQHLTNELIEKILSNLERSNWRCALITEDVHDPLHNAVPNQDLPSHSVRTRRLSGSGVFIDRPPFNRQAQRVATIFESDDARRQSGGLLVLELRR